MNPAQQNQTNKKPDYDFIVNQPGFEDKKKPKKKLLIIVVLSCLLPLAVVIGAVIASKRNVKPQVTMTAQQKVATDFVGYMKDDNNYKKAVEIEGAALQKSGQEFSIFALDRMRERVDFKSCVDYKEYPQKDGSSINAFSCQQYDTKWVALEIRTAAEGGKTVIISYGVRDDK